MLVITVGVASPAGVIGGSVAEDPPAAYYGEATINGQPLPANTTIVAKVDGEIRGSITLEEAGQYGGAGGFEEKLTVSGEESDTGATVRFFVGGVQATETVEWESGDLQELNLTFTDEEPPSAAAGGDREVEVGEEISFDGTNSSDNGVVVDFEWGFGDGATAEGKHVAHEYNEPGEYAVTLAVADAGGLTDTDTITVLVTDSSEDEESSGGSGGGAGGGAGGGSGGDDEDGTEEESGDEGAEDSETESGTGEDATVQVTSSDEVVVVEVRNVSTGASVPISFDDVERRTDGVRLERLELDFSFGEPGFQLEVEGPQTALDQSIEFDEGTALSYLRIRPSDLDAQSLEVVRIRFAVDAEVLPDGAEFSAVSMYRYQNGSWVALDTQHRGEGEFIADSPGFSVFAIGIDAADVGETQSTTSSNTTATQTQTTTGESGGGDGGEETTSGASPGFGSVLMILVLLLVGSISHVRD